MTLLKSSNVDALYHPQTYQDLLAATGHGGFLKRTIFKKLMADSGFTDMLGMARDMKKIHKINTMLNSGNRSQKQRPIPMPISKRASMYRDQMCMTKEAFDIRKGIANAALFGSLMNPFKSMADDAMLAAARSNQQKLMPSISQELGDTINNLGFFKRMAAKSYGVEGIASDLAKAKANYNVMKQYGMPLGSGGRLNKDIYNLKNTIANTGDVDINHALSLYDDLLKFNQRSTDQIQKYIPQTLATK